MDNTLIFKMYMACASLSLIDKSPSCLDYLTDYGIRANSLIKKTLKNTSGPCFNIKMSSYQYRKSHCGDKTVVRSSYLHNGISYTGKMASLYWFCPLVSMKFQWVCKGSESWHTIEYCLTKADKFFSGPQLVMRICIREVTVIGSDNGLSPGRRQAIIWTSAGILLIWSLGTTCVGILSKIHTFLLKNIHLKISSTKWHPFCLCLNVLIQYIHKHASRKLDWAATELWFMNRFLLEL